MDKERPTDGADKAMEAGVFYPRHCIVVGLASDADAKQAVEALQKADFAEADIQRIDSHSFAAQAEANLDSAGVFAALGKSVQIRQKQLELAQQGVQFVVIRAPESKDTERAVAALQPLAVRYAVKYELLVIEDLIQFFKPARAGTPNELAV